jgi:nucleotide-binding universal stress UspA family protein
MHTIIAADIAHDRPGTPGAAQNVLIAIHGHEPDGWIQALARTAPRAGVVRALDVQDTGAAAFTSLLPPARRWYQAALAMRHQAETDRCRRVLDALAPLVPDVEVVRLRAGGDPAGAITAYARDWPADIVVVGRDRRPALERALLGSIHERVVRRSRCSVLVVPAGAAAEPLPDAVLRLSSSASAREGA